MLISNSINLLYIFKTFKFFVFYFFKKYYFLLSYFYFYENLILNYNFFFRIVNQLNFQNHQVKLII